MYFKIRTPSVPLASSLMFTLLCRLVVSRHWFARCFGPETEKTSQNQQSVPCATLRQGTRTLRWLRMLSDCTTACPWSSNYCILHHTGRSLRCTLLLCSLKFPPVKRWITEWNLPSKAHLSRNVFLSNLCPIGYSGSDPEPGPVSCKPRSPQRAGGHSQTGTATGQSTPRHAETHQHGRHTAAVCGENAKGSMRFCQCFSGFIHQEFTFLISS